MNPLARNGLDEVEIFLNVPNGRPYFVSFITQSAACCGQGESMHFFDMLSSNVSHSCWKYEITRDDWLLFFMIYYQIFPSVLVALNQTLYMNLYRYLYVYYGDKFLLYFAAKCFIFDRVLNPFEKYNKISVNEPFYDRFFVGISEPLLSADQSYITIMAFI